MTVNLISKKISIAPMLCTVHLQSAYPSLIDCYINAATISSLSKEMKLPDLVGHI